MVVPTFRKSIQVVLKRCFTAVECRLQITGNSGVIVTYSVYSGVTSLLAAAATTRCSGATEGGRVADRSTPWQAKCNNLAPLSLHFGLKYSLGFQ